MVRHDWFEWYYRLQKLDFYFRDWLRLKCFEWTSSTSADWRYRRMLFSARSSPRRQRELRTENRMTRWVHRAFAISWNNSTFASMFFTSNVRVVRLRQSVAIATADTTLISVPWCRYDLPTQLCLDRSIDRLHHASHIHNHKWFHRLNRGALFQQKRNTKYV